MVRIAGLDPGMQRDSFAIVIIETNGPKIRVRSAYSWQGKSYLEVEKRLSELHDNSPCKYYVVEQNNVGIHVIETLRKQYKLPVKAVTTSKDIKEPTKHPDTMDKNEMARWMITQKEKGNLVFPSLTTSKHMQELKRQLSIFEEQKTSSGSVRYNAPSGEHDDYVMALMLACWYAEKFSKHVFIYNHRTDYENTIESLNEEYEEDRTGLYWVRG